MLELGQAHRSGAASAETQLGCRGLAEIDDAAAMEGAAIVDGNLNLFTGALVGDHHLGAKWQGTMSGGHGVFVEDLA